MKIIKKIITILLSACILAAIVGTIIVIVRNTKPNSTVDVSEEKNDEIIIENNDSSELDNNLEDSQNQDTETDTGTGTESMVPPLEETVGKTGLTQEEFKQILDEADYMAAGYDYDGAMELLKTIENGQEEAEIVNRNNDFTQKRDAMVPVDMDNITHIFYHSLIVDTERGFTGPGAGGFKQWMTTVYEFDKITQEMYDRGYVLISLNDMVEKVTDENGKVTLKKKQLYLPQGKTPFVMSQDDLSYYHSYDGHGIASKIVIDENGKPTCEYIQNDGTVVYGDYDCVPRLNKFLEEHPDGAYHGARGTIALTGYNGIFGYRTDIAYKTREKLDNDQKEWLDNNPDFDYEAECEEAKKVAEAIKATGWTIASHTWGHMPIGDSSMRRVVFDTEKWKTYVEPLVGQTDIIVFAHGQDLCGEEEYTYSNEKFAYLKEQGYNIFCNVDSSQYFLQYGDDYLRMGRRNLDGYRLWNDAQGSGNYTSDIITAAQCIDPNRTDMPKL